MTDEEFMALHFHDGCGHSISDINKLCELSDDEANKIMSAVFWRIAWVEPAGYWQACHRHDPSIILTAYTRDKILADIETIEKRKRKYK
jgi:hypothetical protein